MTNSSEIADISATWSRTKMEIVELARLFAVSGSQNSPSHVVNAPKRRSPKMYLIGTWEKPQGIAHSHSYLFMLINYRCYERILGFAERYGFDCQLP